MGYYTRHELKIMENRGFLTDLEVKEKTVSLLTDLGVIGDALCDDLSANDWVKWYEHESDMRKVSSQIPDVIFELSGEGEESGDIWKEYYLNGKMQRCNVRLVFDSFDENLLT